MALLATDIGLGECREQRRPAPVGWAESYGPVCSFPVGEKGDHRVEAESTHKETVLKLEAVAVALAVDAHMRRELVGQMAWYLVWSKPAVTVGAAGGGHDADRDLLSPWKATLPTRQRQVLQVLLAGRGIREAGRQLGMSHVAIIKHREKILCRLRKFLAGAPVPPASDGQQTKSSGGGALPDTQQET